MSHDRGCPCGRESYEYYACDRSECMRSAQRNQARYSRMTNAPSRHVAKVAELIIGMTRLEKIELLNLLEKR